MKPAHPNRSARPLLIVGWDGATPELTGPWMDDGTLPELASLRAAGASAPLRSLLHPLSPAAWTSAFTGLGPGRHGIWDFGQRRRGSYEIHPTDARQRHGATLWDIAERCGLKTLVINVPIGWPEREPLPGQGLRVGGIPATELSEATWPRSLAAEIKRELPNYRIDANAYEHADPQAFLDACEAMVAARTALVERLIHRERPDLVVCVFVASDRVQHAFWRQASHPDGAQDRAGWRFADSIRRCYEQLDASLGILRRAVGPEATTLVLSDHGFGDLDGDLYLNAVLEELGLITVRRVTPTPIGGLRGRLWRRMEGALPPSILRTPVASEDPALPGFGDIVWERTRAYSRGLFGNIWLNLRGREPLGQVEPGPEAEGLLDRISARLLQLREPGGGGPLIDAVLRGAELYSGPEALDAPDLVVVPHGYRWMTRSGREFGPRGQVCAEPAVRHSGNHRLNGVFVGAGPGIQGGARPDLLRLLDVTPTALALLGIEVPQALDGQPMAHVLSCDHGITEELPWRQPMLAQDLGAEQEAAMEAQLRGLGYLADGG